MSHSKHRRTEDVLTGRPWHAEGPHGRRAMVLWLRAMGVLFGAIALGAFLPVPGSCEENFPPPEFAQPYQFPPPTTPAARAAVFGYIDVAVLLVALSLAAYLGLKKRSRRDLVILVAFSLLYFGFYRRGCICSVGALQNVALSIWGSDYVLPTITAAFFLLPLLFAVFFGRVFCAAVCPLGAAQELVLLKPAKVPTWLDNALGVIPFVYLGVAVLFAATNSAFVICQYDPFVLFFRLGGSTAMLIVGILMLLLSTVIGRPYCRYLCPYGVLLRLLSPLAKWQPRITTGDCNNCHLCAHACPYDAIRAPTPPRGTVKRTEGRTQLAWLIAALPIAVAICAFLGWRSSPVLSQVNPRVRLAERVWQEDNGEVEGQTEASEAFEKLGVPAMDLYKEAAAIRRKFDTGSTVLGGWIGLVLVLRMIAFSIRRSRDKYQIDQAACVACARCYEFCPIDRERGQAQETKQIGARE